MECAASILIHALCGSIFGLSVCGRIVWLCTNKQSLRFYNRPALRRFIYETRSQLPNWHNPVDFRKSVPEHVEWVSLLENPVTVNPDDLSKWLIVKKDDPQGGHPKTKPDKNIFVL